MLTAMSAMAMAGLLCLLRWRGLDRGAAAVGSDDGAGHVAGSGGGEEGDDLGDLARLGRPGQGGGVPEAVEELAGFGPGVDGAGGHRVDPHASRAVLRRPALGE